MGQRPAPGAPGIEPKWTSSAKSAIGTALSRTSRVWFTISHGIFNEIYYPRLDHACTRDMGLIVTDGREYFSEEKRHAVSQVACSGYGVPAWRLLNTCGEGRYRIDKEIVADPERDVVLQRTLFTPLAGSLSGYHLYVLLAPHLDNHGAGNNAWVEEYKGRRVLFAERPGYALALACSLPYLKCSAGYVGVSDAWQDLSRHKLMTWEYDCAEDGNVALAAELDITANGGECILALGFGRDWSEAAQSAVASLQDGFEASRDPYVRAWQDWQRALRPVEPTTGRSDLYWISATVLRVHEDKSFPGAVTASLSIPWGFSKGDEDLGGYHLVWPRDLVQAAGGMMAAGACDSARAVLRYLQATQESDGHWPQNMWLDGTPYWNSVQMDETALPILLLDQMRREDAIGEGGLARYWPMARNAVSYLVRNGPVSPEDRWETDPGYTPFTLAAEISALLAAADLAELSGEPEIAPYLRETADTWNDHIERWIFATGNDLTVRLGIRGYYMRVAPDDAPPGPEAAHVLSPDFLSLVRFGLRSPADPRILDTIRAVDHELRTEMPNGPLWRRYTGDLYGEYDDGSPYNGAGRGRLWPLLTGERAHYELAAGRPDAALKLLRTFEACANDGCLLPEQIWDSHDLPEAELFFGRPSGSAMPLVWAHAEYLKLRRSIAEGRVYDMPPQTFERYVAGHRTSPYAVWRFSHKLTGIPCGRILRIETTAPARIVWTRDDWRTIGDANTRDSRVAMHLADLPTATLDPGHRIAFTIYWPGANRWEGTNFTLEIE